MRDGQGARGIRDGSEVFWLLAVRVDGCADSTGVLGAAGGKPSALLLFITATEKMSRDTMSGELSYRPPASPVQTWGHAGAKPARIATETDFKPAVVPLDLSSECRTVE